MRKLFISLILFLLFAFTINAQVKERKRPLPNSEERTARYLESIRKSPPQQLAFFLRMPKGGDIHNHLTGSIYAESYVKWAADKGLCINSKTMVLNSAPCEQNSDQVPVATALTNFLLYRQIIDSWSMRNWQYADKNAHDQFFDAFSKFGPATYDQVGRMIAEAAARAARGRVLYLELMLTPDGGLSSQIGARVGWNNLPEDTLAKLRTANISDAVGAGIKNLRDAEAEKNKLLKCGEADADPGCAVTIRYIAQVARGAALGPVFAQMVTGFMLASEPGSRVVALNLVQPEDGLSSMDNFSKQIQMLRFLKTQYPNAHLTLHAGELSLGSVPPEGLSFHIRDSVRLAGAERIGHGVDVMHETEPYALLKEMATRHILVEICLSSNDLILGVGGANHPLATYLEYGVPVALATDDEGVSRSEISREFLKASLEHGLNYSQLKTIARNSLTYAFIEGRSLWRDSKTFSVVPECAADRQRMNVGARCQEFLTNNEKAHLQWRLEEQFKSFEGSYP